MHALLEQTLLPANAVCARYMISPRTLSRWMTNGFPDAVRINGRRFFVVSELDDWDRIQLAARNGEGV
jgi:hypothetical protein